MSRLDIAVVYILNVEVFLSLSKATVLWETQDLGTGHISVSEQGDFTFSIQKNKHLIIEAVPLLCEWKGPTHSVGFLLLSPWYVLLFLLTMQRRTQIFDVKEDEGLI